jgi:hypothetical protein
LKRLGIALLLCVGLALPAVAGIEYRARTWQEGAQKNKQMESSVKASIDGDKARIDFEDSGNSTMPVGSYLLTTDAGRTLFLVKPEDKTYGEFDLEAVMQILGAMSESGLMDFQIDNARVESLDRGAAKTVAGIPTEHARFRTTYDMTIKVLGMGRTQNVETVQDIWYSEDLQDAAMGVWLRKEPPRTGTELDELVDLEVAKIRGLPLETVSTTTTTGRKGRSATTTTHTLVSDLRQGVSFPAGTFVIPDDYTPVEMMPTEAMLAGDGEQADGEEEQEGGLLGRFKKFGKKKDG